MTIVNAGVDKVARKISRELLDDREQNKYPRGFVDLTDSILSYDNGLRTITLTPNPEQLVYVMGNKLLINTVKQVQHTTAVGVHYITMDANGDLVSSVTPWDLTTAQPVAIVYWNGATGYWADERHGNIPAQLHKYLHQTVGSRWEQGLQVTATVTPSGNPTAESQHQFSITQGYFFDEDLEVFIAANGQASPFIPAQVPCMYWAGTAWSVVSAATHPFIPGANRRVSYNPLAGGLTEGSVGDFIPYFLFATNFQNLPLVLIPGSRPYASLTLAQLSSPNDLPLGQLPTPEMLLVGRFIFQTGTYASIDPDGVTRRYDDYRRSVGPTSQVATAVSHASLSGLAADDHPQYVLHGESRQSFTATAGQTVFDLSFTYTTGANELLVFVNGVLQEVTTDYTETDSDTITFTSGLPVGTKVRIIRL